MADGGDAWSLLMLLHSPRCHAAGWAQLTFLILITQEPRRLSPVSVDLAVALFLLLRVRS